MKRNISSTVLLLLFEEGKALAQKYDMDFSEVSAKTKDNFEKTMNEFIFGIVKDRIKIFPMKEISMNFLLCLN